MGETLKIEVYSGSDWASSLRDRWVELQGDSLTATPFQTWEWHSTWASVFRGKPRVLLISEGSDLVGLYPMVQGTIALRPMACGPSDYLHPLVRTGFEAAVWEALMAGFQGEKLVDLHQISARVPSYTAPASATTLTNSTCLTVDLPDSYEAYVGKLSKSLRYDVRRLDRSFFASGEASIVRADAQGLGMALDVFFEQHRKRWKSRGLPGAFMGKSEAFHRRWVAIAEERGWLRLSTLIYQGKPIGSIYAMTHGGSCYYYQAGFDPDFSSISPGTLLVANTIKAAIEEGVQSFDFCRGDEPYKRRWQPDHVYVNHRFLIGTSQVREHYLKQAWRVEERIRQRLEGGSLFPKRRK
ncbi:MAG: GNAT family N-acetyltransferase [Fimbriimonadaceae bacterium]